MTTLRSILLLSLLGMLTIVSVQAQQPAATPPPAPVPSQLTFKVDVNYVEIDATVTDRQGSPVLDLSREEFQILEEGRSQAVTVFSKVDLPVERLDPPLFRAAAVEPDVRSNTRQFDGRVFVLMLDDLHISFARTARLRAAATEFISHHLGANDLAAVIYTSGAGDRSQEFTSSRPLLLRAVNKFLGQRLSSGAAALGEERALFERTGRDPAGARDPEAAERSHKARQLLIRLRAVADYLAGVQGRRKAVLLFSEGIDTGISNASASLASASSSHQGAFGADLLGEMRDTIGAAGRANVSIYPIDPRGLVALESFDASLGAQQLDTMSNMADETRRAQDSLRLLAEQTGGVAAVDRNNYEDTFTRIVRDNSTYYVLGYYSSNTKPDGRFRPVDVKVRRPGLTVRARKGYVAPKGETPKTSGSSEASAALRDALNSPIPVSGLGITAGAVLFRGAGKASVLVVVEVDGSRFVFADREGRLWDQIELVTLPLDARGRPVEGTRDEVSITPRPQTRDAIVARGVRLTRRLSLAPGRYQLRVGAREAGTGGAGSVLIDLDVPDFGAAPLSMSGLVLASDASGLMPTARPDEALKDVLPAAPTVRREFPRGDALTVYAEIYDNLKAPHTVEIATTATADDGRVMFSRTDGQAPRSPGEAFGHTVTIPLKDVAPGRYVLKITARASAGKTEPAVRELEFTVR